MKKVLHVSLLLSIIILLIGCGGGSPKPSQTSQQAQIKKPANYETVQAAFKDSLNVYNSNSRWFQDKEVLELTIIGPVYKNPIEKQSSAYKKLATLLKKIAKDKTLLDKLSNFDISKRYSKINYIPYKLGSNEDATFTAVYEQRLDSKEKLRQTLQELDANGKDKIGQTLAIWINPQDLKNNTYTLEGYKSVKNSTKNRNSAYYHLSKGNSNGTDNQDIINAVLATLQLSIPEYVAIDRKDMLKQGETFRIITDNPDGTATGKVYKFDIETEVDKLQKQIKETTDTNQIAKLQKQIQEVKASKAWREYQTKQLLNTTPVDQKMIDILNKYNYTNTKNSFNKLGTSEAREISKVLHYSLPDSFLVTAFEQYRYLLNELEMNVGSIEQVGKAHYIRGQKASDVEEEHSGEALGNVGFALAFVPVVNLLSFAATEIDQKMKADIEKIQEDKQYSIFLGSSKHNTGMEGFKKVYEEKFNSIKYGLELKEDEDDEYIFAAVSADEKLLFTLHKNSNKGQYGVLRDLNTMKVKKKLNNLPQVDVLKLAWENNMSQRVSFGKDNDSLVMFSKNKLVLFDIKLDKIIREYNLGEDLSRLINIEVSPNGKYILARTLVKLNLYASFSVLIDYETGKVIKRFGTSGMIIMKSITNTRFNAENKVIVFNEDKTLLFDPETLKNTYLSSSANEMYIDGMFDDSRAVLIDQGNTFSVNHCITIWNTNTNTLDKKSFFDGRVFMGYSADFKNQRIFTVSGVIIAHIKNLDVRDMNTGKLETSLVTKGMPTIVIPSKSGKYVTVYTKANATNLFDLSFLNITQEEY